MQNEGDEPIHHYNYAKDLLVPEMVGGEDIGYCEEQRQFGELVLRFQIKRTNIAQIVSAIFFQLVIASFNKLPTSNIEKGRLSSSDQCKNPISKKISQKIQQVGCSLY